MFNVINTSALPNIVYTYNTIQIKIPIAFCWSRELGHAEGD